MSDERALRRADPTGLYDPESAPGFAPQFLTCRQTLALRSLAALACVCVMQCTKCGKEVPSSYYLQPGGVCAECDARLTPEERQALSRPAGLRRMTSTTFELPGYRVVEFFGVVRGITVRSRSIFGTIGGALQTVVGGNISLFTDLCEQTRNEAFEMMLQHAAEMGANAVLGVRYDATEVMDGVTEVLCYGTAVVVEPVKA